MDNFKNKNITKNLYIQIMEESDLEDARLMHNDESTLFQLTDVNHVNEYSQKKWFEKLSLSNSSKRYVARLKIDSSFVGVFRIDNLDYINKSAHVGLDIVSNMRGKGYAKEIYKYFFEYLFNQQCLNRLALVTLENNQIALNLYNKMGFIQEGINRKAIFRFGKFNDLVCMSLLKEEWLKSSF